MRKLLAASPFAALFAALFAGALIPIALQAADGRKDPTAVGERKVGKGLNFYSIEKEIALGKQLAIEVEKQARIVDDPIVSEYVSRLGQNLALHSDVGFPISIKVIQSDEINAFTLPGGFIFVNTGLIMLTANEAQLASAIAHELGHSAARHATRQASQNQLVRMGTLPLFALGGLPGLAARQVASAVMPMAFLQFSRAFETEADTLGLQYLWKAGYDPEASIDLLETIESTERRQPGSVSKLFRSHPLTSDRIRKTQHNIDIMLPSRESYVINTSEYEEVRDRLNDLIGSHSNAPVAPTLERR